MRLSDYTFANSNLCHNLLISGITLCMYHFSYNYVVQRSVQVNSAHEFASQTQALAGYPVLTNYLLLKWYMHKVIPEMRRL